MHANVWFEFVGGLLWCQNLRYMGGKRDNKEWGLNWEHLFPSVSGYKRRSDIKDIDIMELECTFTDNSTYVLFSY